MSIWQGLQWRLTTLATTLQLRRRGVRLGRKVQFDGFPIVSGCGNGSIIIGDSCTLVSNPKGTALGVRAPVILRLLAPGASIEIGPDCGLSGTVICAAERIAIGARCLFGADVMIFDTDFHHRDPKGRRYAETDWAAVSKRVLIGDDVFVGARATICKGATIGYGAIIGAGSVVTGDVPDYAVAAGIPARQVGDVREGR